MRCLKQCTRAQEPSTRTLPSVFLPAFTLRQSPSADTGFPRAGSDCPDAVGNIFRKKQFLENCMSLSSPAADVNFLFRSAMQRVHQSRALCDTLHHRSESFPRSPQHAPTMSTKKKTRRCVDFYVVCGEGGRRCGGGWQR